MKNFVLIRKSQIYHYVKTPLYTRTEKGDYVLYKSENLKVDPKRFLADGSPQLYTPADVQDLATRELRSQLNQLLVKNVKLGDLGPVRSVMCDIVDEAFQEPIEENLHILPDTLDILYEEYSNTTKLLKTIGNIRFGGSTLVEHSVNTMVLTLNYCIYGSFSERDTKKLSLAALLHDIGLARLPRKITEADRELTDKEWAQYQTHSELGHKIILDNMRIDPSASIGVLEHHERLDGTGYPMGLSNVSFAGCLIGMVDSFESLTNTEMDYRKRKDPFGAMKIIQDEILNHSRYDRAVYKNFCLSLQGKSRYFL